MQISSSLRINKSTTQLNPLQTELNATLELQGPRILLTSVKSVGGVGINLCFLNSQIGLSPPVKQLVHRIISVKSNPHPHSGSSSSQLKLNGNLIFHLITD